MEFQRTIIVSDDEKFDGKDWRKALTKFITKIFAGVLSNGCICIDDYENGVLVAKTVISRYRAKNLDFYVVEGRSLDDPPEGRTTYYEGATIQYYCTLVVTNDKIDFEWGLANFVYDDKIWKLLVNLGGCRWLHLWKKDDGLLGVKIMHHD